jgi:sugar lactone lactonase YvrE
MKTVKLLLTTIIALTIMKSSFALEQNYYLGVVQQSSTRWTGIAVTDEERVFVCYPREGNIPFSVAEVVDETEVPYPNMEWNNWSLTCNGSQHFVSVNSVYIDKNGYLWILDSGSILGNCLCGCAKLIKVDLATDSIVQIIPFNNTVVNDSCYLNDVRIDTERNFAYISESGQGSIIVVDLTTGNMRKLLYKHPTVLGEEMPLCVSSQIFICKGNVNGIALTQNGNYLYYKPLTSYDLFRIPTDLLRDSTLNQSNVENGVEFVCTTLPSDGMEFDHHGRLFMTGIEDNAIYYLTPGLTLLTAIVDSRIKYPEGISITENDEVYFTTTRRLHVPGTYFIYNLKPNPQGVDDQSGNQNNISVRNYPNPFQNQTMIEYQISQGSEVSITITDVMGKVITRQNLGYQEVGTYQIDFQNDRLTTGIYLCILETGRQKKIHKMMIEK